MGPVDQQTLLCLPNPVFSCILQYTATLKTANINKFVTVVTSKRETPRLQSSDRILYSSPSMRSGWEKQDKERKWKAAKFVNTFYRQSIFQMQAQFTANKIFWHLRPHFFSENSSPQATLCSLRSQFQLKKISLEEPVCRLPRSACKVKLSNLFQIWFEQTS